MSFQEQLPEWNNAGGEPSQAKKDEGWLPGEKPPASFFNWFFHRTYKNIVELRNKINETPTVTINQGTTEPFSNTGSIIQILSWLAKVVKGITGKSNWYDSPTKTLEQLNADLSNHVGVGGNVHPVANTTTAGFMSAEDKDALQSMSKYRSGYDAAAQVYTTVDYKRKNGTLYMRSVLSNKVNGRYTVDTRTYYATDGVTVRKTEVWDITYDSDGNPVNEVLR